MLADGSTHDVDVVMIQSIAVDGRTLHNVEASVSPSDTAPILLGLGALNRLGPYTITDGRLVFTGG
jgi:predicted aspartyl protease